MSTRRLAQLAHRGDLDQLLGHVADALLEPGFARLPADPAEPVELRAGLVRAIAAQAARYSRPADRACRRPGNAPRGSHAARRQPRSWSARRSGRCRDRHGRRDRRPARLATSVSDVAAAFRAARRRTSRSPRMSCSPMTAMPGASKPVSSGSTAKTVACAGAARTSSKVSACVVSSSPCSARSVARRSRAPIVQQATITRLPSLCAASRVGDHGVEHVGAFGLALGGEGAALPAAEGDDA